MKTFKSWFRFLPLLPVVFLFTGCYTYYTSLHAQDWPAGNAWADDYEGNVVEVPPVAVFLNPFMFTPCAPPVIYPVYDWYHRCWIPESEFHLWLRGPDVTIAFQWGMDWRFGIRTRHWFPVSRWVMDHPHYRGLQHYAHWEYGYGRNRGPRGSRYTPPKHQDDRWRNNPSDDHGRWDDRSDDRWGGNSGFSGRDGNRPSDQGPGQGRNRQKEQPPKDRNRSFDRQDPVRDRETAATVRRTPPPASAGTLHETVRRIVVGPAETGGNGTTWKSKGKENGTGSAHSGSQTRRVKRSEQNQEPVANKNDSPKTMNRGNNTPSFQMPAFPDNRNRTSRVVKQAEHPASQANPSQSRLKTGSSGNVESPRIKTEIRKRDSGEQSNRREKPDNREGGNSGTRHGRR